MKEKPILFSAPMVRAILDGRKSQTRRLFKPENIAIEPHSKFGFYYETFARRGGELSSTGQGPFKPDAWLHYSPYGQPGDRLWVKETFTKTTDTKSKGCVLYRADMKARQYLCHECGEGELAGLGDDTKALYSEDESIHHWKPSIFMPRKLSRLTLEITAIRVERLQDISEADAKAEGVQIPHVNFPQAADSKFKTGDALGLYRDHYRVLWNNINGPESWDANPWVWVLEFPRIES